MAKNILFIHQSAELYGSDKTLYFLVSKIKNNPLFNPIVVLPEKGPLGDLLRKDGVDVIIMPVIKISRSIFTIKNLASLPVKAFKLTHELNEQLKDKEIDLVHSNTIAVLLGAFYAKRYGIKHLWHVHEIIEKPRLISKIFSLLICFMSHLVIYNSKATMGFWCSKNKGLIKKSKVILNGFDRVSEKTSLEDQAHIRRNLFGVEPNDIVICLVGRVNLWKGHHLLLEAFHQLKKEYGALKLVFVGSAYKGMEYLLDNLQAKITDYNLVNSCKIIPFQNEIFAIWDSIDIAVVPSTEPEPFGLVAVEAMLAKKPVIAAKHGGLTEIIEDNFTGYFFKPLDVCDLTHKLSILIKDKDKILKFGENGYKVAINKFSNKHYLDEFFKIYNYIL